MQLDLGRIAVGADGTRWRIVAESRAKRPDGIITYRGKAVVDGAVQTGEMGPVKVQSVEAAPVYDVGDSVALDGLPAVVLSRHGDGLEASPVDPDAIVYVVRILRDPQPFGSMVDDVRQVHAWGIDA